MLVPQFIELLDAFVFREQVDDLIDDCLDVRFQIAVLLLALRPGKPRGEVQEQRFQLGILVGPAVDLRDDLLCRRTSFGAKLVSVGRLPLLHFDEILPEDFLGQLRLNLFDAVPRQKGFARF